MILVHSTPMAGHSGSNRTKYKIMKLFYWPGMGRDITTFCQACHRCQKTAKKTYSIAPLTITAPSISQPFDKVAIDIVGPLPMTKKKNRFGLTYIDLGFRYPETVPLQTVTARDIATALMSIMTRLSIPKAKEILSDRGSNFLSSVLKETYQFLGISHSRTAVYRPQSNVSVEWFHQTLLQMIRKTIDDKPEWDDMLPFLLFACRTATTTHFAMDWLLQLWLDLEDM